MRMLLSRYNRYGDGGCGPCLWNSSTYPECNRTHPSHVASVCVSLGVFPVYCVSLCLLSLSGIVPLVVCLILSLSLLHAFYCPPEQVRMVATGGLLATRTKQHSTLRQAGGCSPSMGGVSLLGAAIGCLAILPLVASCARSNGSVRCCRWPATLGIHILGSGVAG